jgi:hypothetical protein
MQALIALALFAVALLFRLPFCTADLFTYDAADYSRAIRAGVVAQYLGTDSIKLPDFLWRLRADAKFREHSWGSLYQRNDGAALRHFHVPGGFYIPALLHDGGFGPKAQRVAIALISASTVSAAFLILSAAAVPWQLAGLAGLFCCCSPVLILAGTNLSPHPLFTLFSTVAVYSFCRWMGSASARWMAMFAVCFAVSAASLELAPILLLTVLATAAYSWFRLPRSSERKIPVRQVLVCVGIICASLTLLWPGGWLRGGYVMSYGVFVFQGLFRSAIYFHSRDLFSTVARLGNNPIAGWALIALLIAAVWSAWRSRRDPLLPAFAIFGSLLVIQGFGNGFTNTTYASHAVLAITMASALSFRANDSGLRWGPVAVMAGLSLLGLFSRLDPNTQETLIESRRIAGVIGELTRDYPSQTAFVVTQDPSSFIANAPQFRFYPAKSAVSSLPQPWISTGPYHLLVDTSMGNHVPGTPLCAGPFARYQFALSCQELTIAPVPADTR